MEKIKAIIYKKKSGAKLLKINPQNRMFFNTIDGSNTFWIWWVKHETLNFRGVIESRDISDYIYKKEDK